jgi:hypothetical protein
LGLNQHYTRAELQARIDPDGAIRVEEPVNVTRFAVHPPALSPRGRLFVGDHEVRLPRRAEDAADAALVVGRHGGRWVYLGERDTTRLPGKRPGLQGPIDDAFAGPFLCVRGTGEAWNPAVGAWADASLKRFATEWSRYFRGDLPVKNDTDVTEADLKQRHLLLFGDPGSNRWIRKALSGLPLRWTRAELRMNGARYPASSHAPVLIHPNPLPGAEGRYLVLNSGHTFREKELALLNYLLFPRLGDWAVMKVSAPTPSPTAEVPPEEPVQAGFFDERWSFPAASNRPDARLPAAPREASVFAGAGRHGQSRRMQRPVMER